MGFRGRVVASAVGLVMVVVAVVFGARIVADRHRTDFSRSLDVVPAATKRLAFTDWAAVRTALKQDLGTNPSDSGVNALATKAYNSDLSAASSIGNSAVALQDHFGFSPATVAWEAYSQSDSGAVMVVKMPDGFDFSSVRRHLTASGFVKPAKDDGVWLGGADLVAALDPTLTPELQFVAVLADQGLIVTSDGEAYARMTVRVAEGAATSLAEVPNARTAVDPLAEPAAAEFWTRDFACTDLSMSSADAQTQSQADELIAKAGKVSPLEGYVMAMGPDRSLAVSELFESSAVAQENLRARAQLAVGDAVGRGGSFNDSLKLTSSSTDGATVQLRWQARSRTGYLLSALNSGPVVFATC